MSPLLQKRFHCFKAQPAEELIVGIPALGEKLQGFGPHALEQAEIQLGHGLYQRKELVNRIAQLEQPPILIVIMTLSHFLGIDKFKNQTPYTGAG
jgi:hypothetical protein